MQVYEVVREGSHDFFRNFQDIEPSLQISYCNCKDIKIVKHPTTGPVKIVVTGRRKDESGWSDINDEFTVHRHSVWDSPTHL